MYPHFPVITFFCSCICFICILRPKKYVSVSCVMFLRICFCFCFYIFHKKLDICCIIKVTINFHNYILKRKKISCCNITHDEPDNQIWDSSMFHSNILAAEIHFSYLESEKKNKTKNLHSHTYKKKKKKKKENMEKRKNSIALRVWGSRKLRHTFLGLMCHSPLCWTVVE